MKKVSFFGWLGRGFLAVFSVGTLGLIISGLYYGGWWTAFSLVLFTASVLATVCFLNEATPVESLNGKRVHVIPSRAA